MNIGTLDRQVQLLGPGTATQSGTGEQLAAPYVDRGTVWAGQKPGAGTEALSADQLTARQVVTWTLRYRPDVATTWRLVYAGRTYQLTGVQEIGRRVGLTLTTYVLDTDGQQQ